MDFTDRAPVSGAHRTGSGYLAADARIARTGIQIYSGREVGRPDTREVRVLRPESEVFSHAAMASAAHRPVTLDHPADPVSAANWKRHSAGWTGDTVARDGDFLKIPMILADQATIDAVQAGSREISCGYTCDLDWTAGQTTDGQQYDAVQKQIRINHVAIVPKGRAGSECRFGDSAGTILRPGMVLIDADTGAPAATLNEELIELIVAEAAKLGISVDQYVKEVSRYTFAANQLGAAAMDPQQRQGDSAMMLDHQTAAHNSFRLANGMGTVHVSDRVREISDQVAREAEEKRQLNNAFVDSLVADRHRQTAAMIGGGDYRSAAIRDAALDSGKAVREAARLSAYK